MVNLIPRQIKKLGKKRMALLRFLIFLVPFLTFIYISLASWKKQAQLNIEDVDSQILTQKTAEMVNLENNLRVYKTDVDTFVPYLNNHILTTSFFNFLEENTHPNIYFDQMSLKSSSANVVLSGKADSFLSLGQQLMIFNDNSIVQNVSLSNISLSEEGNIIFNLSLSLNSSLFKR